MFNDAQNMLNKVINEKLFHAVGIVGFYPANSQADDILLYDPDCSNDKKQTEVFYGLRQQVCQFL